MKRIVLYSIGIIFLSIVLVLSLYFKSQRPNDKNNGFLRAISGPPLVKIGARKFASSILTVVNGCEGRVLLRSVEAGDFLIMDSTFAKLRHFKVELPAAYKNKFFVSITGDIVHIMAYSARTLISVDTRTNTYAAKALNKLFSPAIAIGKDQYVIRSVDVNGLRRKFIRTGHTTTAHPEELVTETLDDAGMVTDGQLLFDDQSKTIIYTYYFGNGFVCMDTNLCIRYRARTIDTVTQWQATVTRRPNSMTHIKPPKLVSMNASADQGLLYIESGLKADNESSKRYDSNSVIDIYRINDGKYLRSFYLPSLRGKKCLNFCVTGAFIIANYGQEVIEYAL